MLTTTQLDGINFNAVPNFDSGSTTHEGTSPMTVLNAMNAKRPESKHRAIFDFVKTHPGSTARTISEALHIPTAQVYACLSIDTRRGLYEKKTVWDNTAAQFVRAVTANVDDYDKAAPFSVAQKSKAKAKKRPSGKPAPVITQAPAPAPAPAAPPAPTKSNVDALIDMVMELPYREVREFVKKLDEVLAEG